MKKSALIQKYNIPVPRYTSYPTIPMWNKEKITQKRWQHSVQKAFNDSNQTKGISLYIHLPYCEKLCLFCACNKKITKDHDVETPYIDAVISEWGIYRKLFDQPPIIKEIHLGGGTPTFFSSPNLTKLIQTIQQTSKPHVQSDFSFEAHPNNTTDDHLNTLYQFGFKRISFGIQDFDPAVQQAVGRIQSFDTVERITKMARKIGYQSINYDLIYGLPKQNIKSIEQTTQYIANLLPDRIALYSFAYVPWAAKGQQLLVEAELPNNMDKQTLHEISKEKLLALGYVDIGMDHFALKTDPLYLADQAKKLHRNFMGYNTWNTDLLIGLGASAISDAKYGYAQNNKSIEQYIQSAKKNQLDLARTHTMSTQDQTIKQAILNILCQKTVHLTDSIKQYLSDKHWQTLQDMQAEQLITLEKNTLSVTPIGMPFIRNICAVFDQYLPQQTDQLFSKSI